MKIVSLVFLLLLCHSLKGQEGAPLLTSFKESSEPENQSWAICQDDNNVMLFANRRGILTFDGQGWSFIPIPTIPYSLKYNQAEKKVFPVSYTHLRAHETVLDLVCRLL